MIIRLLLLFEKKRNNILRKIDFKRLNYLKGNEFFLNQTKKKVKFNMTCHKCFEII